ncbi:hypothetical protein PIB30_063668 [Stylosanthes scabra]|uniref:SWIM-type domain-containing protein n=1 Tax=Stylosanthes scabra TaxID=79078 RepID=A0ABU6RMM5_9FABA|nr:hypothetical protein [Stylosanthes scabra]
MFRDVQEQFLKKGDYIVKVLSKKGDMYSLLVGQQKLISDKPVVDTYRVSFDSVVRERHCECNLFQSKEILCYHVLHTIAYFEVNEVPTCYVSSRWSKNVRRKHTYIKSCHDVNRSYESNKVYRGLCSHFFNVVQDFVRNIEDASILHSAMDDAQTTLHDHRAYKDQSSVPNRQSNKAPETQCSISVDRLLCLPQVSTKGRPTKRRLGAEFDKAIKNDEMEAKE